MACSSGLGMRFSTNFQNVYQLSTIRKQDSRNCQPWLQKISHLCRPRKIEIFLKSIQLVVFDDKVALQYEITLLSVFYTMFSRSGRVQQVQQVSFHQDVTRSSLTGSGVHRMLQLPKHPAMRKTQQTRNCYTQLVWD